MPSSTNQNRADFQAILGSKRRRKDSSTNCQGGGGHEFNVPSVLRRAKNMGFEGGRTNPTKQRKKEKAFEGENQPSNNHSAGGRVGRSITQDARWDKAGIHETSIERGYSSKSRLVAWERGGCAPSRG